MEESEYGTVGRFMNNLIEYCFAIAVASVAITITLSVIIFMFYLVYWLFSSLFL